MRRILAALLMVLPAASAFAQDAVCVDAGSGQVDPAASGVFADLAGRTEPAVRQALAGTWYSETPAPMTGQVSRLLLTYGSDGRLSYDNEVCDASGFCGRYQGAGYWAAVVLGDGSLSGMQIVSDQGRNHACTGFSARLLDAATLQYGAGGIARRVP